MEMYNAFYSDGDIVHIQSKQIWIRKKSEKKKNSYHNGLNDPMSSI